VNNHKELRWLRIFTPNHIPRKYVEQLKGVNFSVDQFYEYQEKVCVVPTSKELQLNPLNHLYVLTNKENEVKGFLWFVIDSLSSDIVIQNLSVDQLYWGGGKIIETVTALIQTIREKANLKDIYFITRCPRHASKMGFKPAKDVLMIYDPSLSKPKEKEEKTKDKISEKKQEKKPLEQKKTKDKDGK
jgi:N-acetylglutamate synthase-like GNAT family acetyltransferase